MQCDCPCGSWQGPAASQSRKEAWGTCILGAHWYVKDKVEMPSQDIQICDIQKLTLNKQSLLTYTYIHCTIHHLITGFIKKKKNLKFMVHGHVVYTGSKMGVVIFPPSCQNASVPECVTSCGDTITGHCVGPSGNEKP